MSDEEKKESLVDGEESEESTSQPQKKGAFLSPFLIRILTIIAAVIGMVFIAFIVSIVVLRVGRPASGGTGVPEVEGLKKIEVEHLMYFQFTDAFTQQLSDGRMLKLKIALGYKSGDKRLQMELTEIYPEMRDIVIKQLTRLNSEYFAEETALDNLQEDLLKQINRIINNGKVERILFQEFTIM